MKKIFILFAAVAMMAMTACNEKPAKNGQENNDATVPATEQTDSAKQNNQAVKIDVERAKPTEDGKDHIAAEFNTADYQVRLENLADGTFRISMWKIGQDKSSKPEQVAESKQCVMKDDGYLMQTKDGTIYVINAKKGSEQLTIMKDDKILYPKL